MSTDCALTAEATESGSQIRGTAFEERRRPLGFLPQLAGDYHSTQVVR